MSDGQHPIVSEATFKMNLHTPVFTSIAFGDETRLDAHGIPDSAGYVAVILGLFQSDIEHPAILHPASWRLPIDAACVLAVEIAKFCIRVGIDIQTMSDEYKYKWYVGGTADDVLGDAGGPS